MKCFLYSLVRPGESLPFYLGITWDWRTRFVSHRRKYGKDVVCSCIAEYSARIEAEKSESAAIAYWVSQGVILENVAKTVRDTRKNSERMREIAKASWLKRKGFRGARYKPNWIGRDCG